MERGVLFFLASLAAVLAIVVTTYLLGFREAARLSSIEEARELFRLAPGGFEPEAIGLDDEGRAAIASDASGRRAVLVPHGNQFVFRLLAPGERVAARGGQLSIHALPAVQITLKDNADDWATTDNDANSA